MEHERSLKIRMAAARVNSRQSQEKVAKRMGVTKRTIINWENNKTCPSDEYFNKFCEICGIDKRYVKKPER